MIKSFEIDKGQQKQKGNLDGENDYASAFALSKALLYVLQAAKASFHCISLSQKQCSRRLKLLTDVWVIEETIDMRSNWHDVVQKQLAVAQFHEAAFCDMICPRKVRSFGMKGTMFVHFSFDITICLLCRTASSKRVSDMPSAVLSNYLIKLLSYVRELLPFMGDPPKKTSHQYPLITLHRAMD